MRAKRAGEGPDRLLKRRTFALGLASIAGAVAAGGGAASAQALDWLNTVPGFGAPKGAADRRGDARARDASAGTQNDLRADSIPLRSEEMLDVIAGAIDLYGRIARKGGWPALQSARLIRPGDDDERVAVARRRLAITGDYRGGNLSSFTMDGELEAAVRRFQERHGIRVSGRLDGPTIQAMNVPVQARIAQLQLNYRRIEELLGQRTEDRYVLVNVPAFQLEAVSQNVVELRHRIIAGKPERQTPQVKAHIRALNFFPYWRVPESVAALDLIPRLQKEPDYLQKEQIRVLNGAYNGPEIDATQIDWRQVDASRLRFRQDPGPQNALGLLRLDMPNEHGVYMHDTPMKPLFAQRARAFSAGCVRVQDVFDLAAWVARDEPGLDRTRIDEILNSGQAVDITLKVPVPVYFTYITAWAERNGRIEFRPDIYGRDGLRELAGDRERDPDAPPLPTQTLAP
jgi:murein L,D-transpeptidase YcbB/YkuD